MPRAWYLYTYLHLAGVQRERINESASTVTLLRKEKYRWYAARGSLRREYGVGEYKKIC